MRLLPVFFFAGSIGLITLACGGASEQDVLSASSTSSSTSSTSSSGSTAASSSGATASGSTSGSPPSGSTSGGTTPADGGTKPGGPCTQETELNNEPGSANTLDPNSSICGTLLPSGETDFITFDLPANAKSMELTYEGNIKLRIFVEGFDPVDLSSSSNPPIPVAPGKTYIVRIQSGGGGGVKNDWRVNLVTT